MDDSYYDNKKLKFKSMFGKDEDDNLSEFLQYVSIEINRELLGELNDLSKSIEGLTESNHNE